MYFGRKYLGKTQAVPDLEFKRPVGRTVTRALQYGEEYHVLTQVKTLEFGELAAPEFPAPLCPKPHSLYLRL